MDNAFKPLINYKYQGIKYFTFAQDGDFQLESGRYFGPITLAYETYGVLKEDKSNIILIQHALTGNSHVARHDEEDPDEGWWENFMGSGRMLDTDKYFFICINILGSCQGSTGPHSINPSTGKPYGMDFPIITMKDVVKAQKKLLEHLGIEHVFLVIGGSIGGVQALHWAVDYPAFMDKAVIIAAPLKASPYLIAFNSIQRNAIYMDPGWNGGNYYDSSHYPLKGLSLARIASIIAFQCEGLLAKKFCKQPVKGCRMLSEFYYEYGVERYLRIEGKWLTERFDANSYLYLTKMMDTMDITRGFEGKVDEAIARIICKVLVVGLSSDSLVPPHYGKEMVELMQKNNVDAAYREIDSIYGHSAFLVEVDKMKEAIVPFVESL